MTSRPRATHRASGLYSLLEGASFYTAVQNALVRRHTWSRHIGQFARPFPGCRVLDIGCGPGTMLEHLPHTLGAYTGFDMNPGYIAAARARFGPRGTFHCGRVELATLPPGDPYDIVLASSVLHHLDDAEAGRLFELASHALRPGGRLVTYDPAFVDGQHWFARWAIARDRGNAVRTPEAYVALARQTFTQVESTVLHDTLRLPYTVVVMSCTRPPDD